MEGEKSSVEHVSRLERKRIREQQRRVEEGQAFEQLAKVLGQVNGGSESEVDFAHMSRVELVQSSTIALRKLQKEILSLQRAARANGKDVSSSWSKAPCPNRVLLFLFHSVTALLNRLTA